MHKVKRVLVITEDLLPGGASVVLRRIVEFHRVVSNELICITGNMSGLEALPAPFTFDADAAKGGWRLHGRLREVPAMRRLLHRYSPDLIVINVSSPGYMYAFMLQPLPVLYHMHADIKPRGSMLRKLVYPRIRGENKRLIPVSEWHGHHIRERWGVHEKHVTVLRNYPDMLVERGAARDIILTAARFDWTKNPDLWYHAGIRLREVLEQRNMRMIWCAPRWTEEARHMQKLLPEHMEIVVPEGNAALRACFGRARLYLQPSVIEPQGIAVLEALQNGIPCVVSGGTGMSEAVQHDVTGLVVPQHDVDAHVRAIITLLENEEAMRGMGERGRMLIAAEYTAQSWSQRYREIMHGTGAYA